MRRQDRECARTHGIPSITDDHRLLLWIIRDLSPVLYVLGVAKGDDAGDLGGGGGREVFDGAVHDGGTLGVAGDEEGGVWTAGGDVVDEGCHFSNASGVGAAGEEVGGEGGGVVYAL